MSQKLKAKGNQIHTIKDENGNNIQVMDWHGWYIRVGMGKSPFFLNELENRRNNQKSNIIIVTGSPGVGKTYFAIRLCEMLDSKFNPNTQIVFSRPQLLHLIGEKSPLKRGQVIVIDEAHYQMGSRRWMESVQKDLMDALASVRSRGYVVIIVCLHIEMLDVIVRKYVLSFMVHIEDRGVGVAYRLYTPRFAKELFKVRLGTVYLQLPDAERCEAPDCLSCQYRDRCLTTRAIYERRKKSFVDEASKQAEARAMEREEKQIKLSNNDYVQAMEKGWESLRKTSKDNVELASMQVLFTKLDMKVPGQGRCKIIRDIFKFQYPKIFEEMA